MTEIKENYILEVCEKEIEVLEQDMLEKNLSRQFDIVICSHGLEHVIDVKNALSNAVDFLSEDGMMILAYERVYHFSDITVENLASIMECLMVVM